MEKDKLSKKYFNNERFADIFNAILFSGEEIIKKDELKELNNELISNINEKLIINKIRDILKLGRICEYDGVSYLLLGIENQTKIDSDMVLRMFMYDALTYDKQLESFYKGEKNDKIKLGNKKPKIIYPVITLIVYYGTRKWNSPKTLYETLNIKNDYIKKYISDYKINIVSLNELDDNLISYFKTDLKSLIRVLKCRNNKYEFYNLINNNPEFKHINKDTALMIKNYTELEINIDENEEEINMCKAVRELHEDWKNEGIEIGKTEGKIEGIEENRKETIMKLNNKGLNADEISNLLDIDKNIILDIISKK